MLLTFFNRIQLFLIARLNQKHENVSNHHQKSNAVRINKTQAQRVVIRIVKITNHLVSSKQSQQTHVTRLHILKPLVLMVHAKPGKNVSQENRTRAYREPEDTRSRVTQSFIHQTELLILTQDIQDVDPTEKTTEP